MPILEVSNLKKRFGELEVISGISFSVERGEVLSIIGPSGSGKSTLLRCVNQLERIDEGQVSVCGMNMIKDGTLPPVYEDKATLRNIRLSIGLVFQNFNLFPHFSVLQNIIEAPVHVLKQPKEQAREKAFELLEKMGLSDKANAYPCELSGGQMQRVSIARALALNPEILFFDEPTSALDPELTGEILKVIRSLANEKMTMVIVTHEMSFARDVSDNIIFMAQGVIVEQGKASDVINNPENERTKAFLSNFQQ